jgi:hypothetical protein
MLKFGETIMEPAITTKVVFLGTVAGVLSFVFGVPVAIVLAAFFGSSCALMFSSTERTFAKALAFVIMSTTVGAMGASGMTFMVPGFPERLSAFLLSIMAFPLIQALIKLAATLPEKWRDKWM